MRLAKVGVLIDEATVRRWHSVGRNAFELYIKEILEHAGMPYERLTSMQQLRANDWDILIASVVPESADAADRLWSFAEAGGTIISYGGLGALAKRLGCGQQLPIGAGYARVSELGEVPVPLRFLSAQSWSGASPGRGELHVSSPGGENGGSLLRSISVGRGIIHRWSVDIPSTVVQLQQGAGPVLQDGIPCPDGTADIDEGILKADDGVTLHWAWDRERTATGMPYYAYPQADYWREVLLSHLVRCALEAGCTLPFVDYWPEGTERVAVISFDSDFNLDETAMTTLDVLNELKASSTWCMIEPGYSDEVYQRVKAEGHELALHYNALEKEDGIWSAEEFTRQRKWAEAATGTSGLTSNKNHYTRYEGWGELFRWCEANGIQTDQTRGPTKRGNVGFLFGTCHPYFPVAWLDEQNRRYDVLELGFLTQDLNHPSLSDTSVIVPFLERVAEAQGVAHFLFHQIHIHRLEPVRQALREVITEARQRGYTFWTSKQVNDWTRARRSIRIVGLDEDNQVQVERGAATEQVVVWVPLSQAEAVPEEKLSYRYGVPCRKHIH
ncbi:polysaccharide deacetylase family protein [Paenibacillus puerhi]|uniref:hypothetical protein n=1 Tax=Paenibacillus puerhi TaxID=2692622 RepID=UPI0013582C98|nr:hypothetical protein [Paenibacillus puerhi]